MTLTSEPSPYAPTPTGFEAYSPMSEESSLKEEGSSITQTVMAVLFCLLLIVFIGLAALMLAETMRHDDGRTDSKEELGLSVDNKGRADDRYAPASGRGGSRSGTRVITGRTRPSKKTRRGRKRCNTTLIPLIDPPDTTFPPDGINVAVGLINSSLNWSYAPCDDFYKFVCSTFKGGPSVLDKRTSQTVEVVKKTLTTINIPLYHQDPTEKAAGLYRACLRLGSSPSNSEMHLLKRFLNGLGLDFANLPVDPNFDMLSLIVRLSFEFGLQAFVIFGLFRNPPDVPKYTLFMRITEEDQDWMREKHHFMNDAERANLYQGYLRVYDSSLDLTRIVARIVIAESAVLDLMDDLKQEKFPLTWTDVQGLGNYTKHIPKDDWVSVVERATSKTFTAEDKVLLYDKAPALVELMVNSSRLALNDSRVLVSWGLLRRLLPLAHGEWMRKHIADGPHANLSIEDHCFETISAIMSMAVTYRYMQTFVPHSVVASARRVVTDIRDTLEEKLNSTPWIEDPVREVALRKIADMLVYVAYPKEYENSALVEAFYSRFPDVGMDFFTPYIGSLRQVTIRTFRGDVNVRFKPHEANAMYSFEENTIRIHAGILQPPVFILDAPAAINYGALGQAVGHEMMHGYDVQGIAHDEKLNLLDFSQTNTMKRYAEKVQCLRDSYRRQEGASRARTPDHKIDSEGFADYTGLLLAHAAYRKLPAEERDTVLPDFELTAEQLFFTAHCIKWCAPAQLRYFRGSSDRYWPWRSRCVVPLQNMPEFAAAFECKTGDVMNAEERCPFW